MFANEDKEGDFVVFTPKGEEGEEEKNEEEEDIGIGTDSDQDEGQEDSRNTFGFDIDDVDSQKK